MDRHTLLQVVLWLIALYHLLMGLGGMLSERVAERLARDVFGLRLDLAPQTAHMVKLLGVYAAVFGVVVWIAAAAPERCPALLNLVVLLYLLRVVNKFAQREVYVRSFGAAPGRVWADLLLLAGFGLAVFCLKP